MNYAKLLILIAGLRTGLASDYPRPPSGCAAQGDRYYNIDCDLDGVKDHMCVTDSAQNGEMVWLALSSEGRPNYFDWNHPRHYEDCPGVRACKRPDRGCDQEGDTYMTLDCDGDGIFDHFCRTRRSESIFAWAILSTEGCPQFWDWSNVRKSGECPAACQRNIAWDNSLDIVSIISGMAGGLPLGIGGSKPPQIKRQFFGYCGKDPENDCDGSGNVPSYSGKCARVDRKHGIRDIEKCRELCETTPGCKFYTYIYSNDRDCLMYDGCPQMRMDEYSTGAITRMVCETCKTVIVTNIDPKINDHVLENIQQKYSSDLNMVADSCGKAASSGHIHMQKGHTISVAHTDTWHFDKKDMNSWQTSIGSSLQVKTDVTIGGKLNPVGSASLEVTGKIESKLGFAGSYSSTTGTGTVDTTSTADASAISVDSDYTPWSWKEWHITWREAQVTVPVEYTLECKETGETRKIQGKIETTAVSSAYLQTENRTRFCPAYQGKCRCLEDMSSHFSEGGGVCQRHLNFEGYGCYVAVAMDCQTWGALNTANPDGRRVFDDYTKYYDWPLDGNHFQWTSDICQPDCAAGTYASKFLGKWEGASTENRYLTKKWECSPWTTCPSGTHVIKEGDASNDRVCSKAMLMMGSFAPVTPCVAHGTDNEQCEAQEGCYFAPWEGSCVDRACLYLSKKDCKADDSCIFTKEKECLDFDCGLLPPRNCKADERCTFVKENDQCVDSQHVVCPGLDAHLYCDGDSDCVDTDLNRCDCPAGRAICKANGFPVCDTLKKKMCKYDHDCLWENEECVPFECSLLERKGCKGEDRCYFNTEKRCVDLTGCGSVDRPGDCKVESEGYCMWENARCVKHSCAGRKQNKCKKDPLCGWFGNTCLDYACSVFDHPGRCRKEANCQWVNDACEDKTTPAPSREAITLTDRHTANLLP